MGRLHRVVVEVDLPLSGGNRVTVDVMNTASPPAAGVVRGMHVQGTTAGSGGGGVGVFRLYLSTLPGGDPHGAVVAATQAVLGPAPWVSPPYAGADPDSAPAVPDTPAHLPILGGGYTDVLQLHVDADATSWDSGSPKAEVHLLIEEMETVVVSPSTLDVYVQRLPAGTWWDADTEAWVASRADVTTPLSVSLDEDAGHPYYPGAGLLTAGMRAEGITSYHVEARAPGADPDAAPLWTATAYPPAASAEVLSAVSAVDAKVDIVDGVVDGIAADVTDLQLDVDAIGADVDALAIAVDEIEIDDAAILAAIAKVLGDDDRARTEYTDWEISDDRKRPTAGVRLRYDDVGDAKVDGDPWPLARSITPFEIEYDGQGRVRAVRPA